MLFKINAVPILLSILNLEKSVFPGFQVPPPPPPQRNPTLHTLEMYASNSAGVT